MKRVVWLSALGFIFGLAAQAQVPAALKAFVKFDAPVVALEHVRVIDGTGAAAREDQLVVLGHGKIVYAGAMEADKVPAGAQVLDESGKTVFPGLVGMHEHLFYPIPNGGPGRLALYGEMADSAPRLYLAGGVTTARTTGSIEPYADIEVKKLIDAGKIPGPHLYLTGPYLEGVGAYTPQMHELTGPEDATRTVNYWASEGMTSFKAYMNITPEELKAAIDAAHARRLKITGHLCSVGFREAAGMGIDNLEHGLLVDTEFDPAKKEGVCPSEKESLQALAKMDVEGPEIQGTIKDLITHHVAVTSTLAVFETFAPNLPPMSEEMRVREAMSPDAWSAYVTMRARVAEEAAKLGYYAKDFQMELRFERDFARQGGLLLAGCDPTGGGGVVAGFCDQRELELLAETGFSPEEAIHIATENGAKWLGIDQRVGTIAPGKDADLVVVDGNPAKNIDDVEKVDTVFKDGLGYDSQKLRDSVRGLTGLR